MLPAKGHKRACPDKDSNRVNSTRACLFVCMRVFASELCVQHIWDLKFLRKFVSVYACLRVVMHILSFLLVYIGGNLSVLLLSTLECTPLLAPECDQWAYLCVCVQNRYESVLWFHKWTLDLSGTCWRQANLAYIVYLSLHTMTGMANRVYSLFCAASKPGNWQLRKTICLAYADRLQFKSHFKWTYFLFDSRKKNLNLSDNLYRVVLFKRQVSLVKIKPTWNWNWIQADTRWQ